MYDEGKIASPKKELLVIAPAPPVCANDPPKDRITVEEGPPDRFSIPGEELLLGDHSPGRASQSSPEDSQERQVQPHDIRGSSPDDVPHFAVVPVDDPIITGGCGFYSHTKLFKRQRGPIRLPVDGIQLYMLTMECSGKMARKGGLARATGSYNRNSGHLRIDFNDE